LRKHPAVLLLLLPLMMIMMMMMNATYKVAQKMGPAYIHCKYSETP